MKRFKRTPFQKNKKGLMENKVVQWMLLLITAAVIVIGVVWNIYKYLYTIEPKCGGIGGLIEGVEGTCACANSDSKCPAETESSANHPSCPLDSYSTTQCTDKKTFRKLKALAEKDPTLRGTCCLNIKKGSVLDSI